MEKKINDRISELFDQLDRTLPRKNSQVIRAVESTRLIVADVLAKHTGSDGKIPRNRLNAVINDLVILEGGIYRNLRDELRLVLEQISEDTTESLAEIILTTIGLKTLTSVTNIPEELASISEGLVEAVFSALTEYTYKKFSESVVTSAFNRIGEDGLVLNDRLRNIAHSLRKEIETTLRESIRKGEVTAMILRSVDKTYSELDWRLDTIVETESEYVMRHAVGKFGEESGLVSAVKIVDIPHGDPKVHRRHKCYIYANRDEHGLGKGVYPVGTRKVRNPHPRCRAKLFYVLAPKLKK